MEKRRKVQIEVEHLEVLGGVGHCCGELGERAMIVATFWITEREAQELITMLQDGEEEEEGHGEDSDV